MTGFEIMLGALAGAATGIVITAARVWLVRHLDGTHAVLRLAKSPIPPSRDVVEAERQHRHRNARRRPP